jgi:hypothetical protein
MRSIRFRVVLPLIFGFLALALFAWDYQNERVVASMGMGWDTGPPMWPYRAVPLFSYAVNTPAYVISWPILKLLDLRTLSLQYAVWFPAIVALWWWVGTCIDFDFFSRRRCSRRKLVAGILLAGGVGLLILGARIGLGEYGLFQHYWPGHPPIYAILLLRAAGPMLWCFFLAGALVHSAVYLVRREPPPLIPNPIGYQAFVLGSALLCLNAIGIAYLDRRLSPRVDPNSCEIDRLYRLGCVHGTVTDESDKPVGHIEVNLIPTFKTGNARWSATKSDWTDDQGRYNFNLTEIGEYILAVNSFEASAGPDEKKPFGTLYYRRAEDESGAEPVRVSKSSAINLSPLRVRRLEVATISVNVVWEDGARPERSDIFLHNSRYFGALANSQQVDYGSGKIALPKGFEYEANASVECDGGKVIEQREANPNAPFRVADGLTPAVLTFVLPGPPCVLWKSR